MRRGGQQQRSPQLLGWCDARGACLLLPQAPLRPYTLSSALQAKLRLDAFLSARLPAASRARLQASIKEGLVVVNGRPQVGWRRGNCACWCQHRRRLRMHCLALPVTSPSV